MQNPQDANFRHITCEKLTVGGFAGMHKVEILCNPQGGQINVYNNLHQIVASIGIDANDRTGMVETYFPTGNNVSPAVKNQI